MYRLFIFFFIFIAIVAWCLHLILRWPLMIALGRLFMISAVLVLAWSLYIGWSNDYGRTGWEGLGLFIQWGFSAFLLISGFLLIFFGKKKELSSSRGVPESIEK